ncbi:MAG: PaaI family thioesterase [Acidimicrobiia bacterium]|nr:PaaI family thioesterase [Acidimicrobiia bacterium]
MNDREYADKRVEAAEQLRRLGHALVAHRPDVDVLDHLIELVDYVLPLIEKAPVRPDPLSLLAEPDVQRAIAEGDLSFLLARSGQSSMFEDSIVSGLANPMSIAATYEHEGEEAVARVILGSAFEGAPGRAHGGIVAALFDETMGAVLPAIGTLGYTGSLTINYRAATPIGEHLEFRARVVERKGRRLMLEATGEAQGSRFADASGVFIAVADFAHPPATNSGESRDTPS